jgi:inorganic pyrophosphatase/exopolyphosphatase
MANIIRSTRDRRADMALSEIARANDLVRAKGIKINYEDMKYSIVEALLRKVVPNFAKLDKKAQKAQIVDVLQEIVERERRNIMEEARRKNRSAEIEHVFGDEGRSGGGKPKREPRIWYAGGSGNSWKGT